VNLGLPIGHADSPRQAGHGRECSCRSDGGRDQRRASSGRRLRPLLAYAAKSRIDRGKVSDNFQQEVWLAAFRLLADMPGVRSLGQVTDPLGRQGVAVAIPYPGEELRVIFDPATGTHLANVMSTGYVAVTAAEWTDQVAAIPTGTNKCGPG